MGQRWTTSGIEGVHLIETNHARDYLTAWDVAWFWSQVAQAALMQRLYTAWWHEG